MATVTLDTREQALKRLFDTHCSGHNVGALAVGDLHVSYPSGAGWIAERKRVDDLAASLTDGRWKDQCGRLFGQTGRRVVIIVEGYLATNEPMRKHTDAAYWNMVLRGVFTFRTACVQETFELLCALVGKLEPGSGPQLAPGSGIQPPKLKPQMASKRQRNSQPDVVFTRLLCCVPSISEPIARNIVSHFKSLPRLQEALGGTNFPEIRVNAKQKLGKSRLENLRRSFLCNEAEALPAKSQRTRRKGAVLPNKRGTRCWGNAREPTGREG